MPPKKRKLYKYEIEANKKERHKTSKAYALKQKKLQYKKDLAKWNKDVKERDNYTCQICKKDLKNEPHNCHAHHILDRKNFKEISTDVNNGITLCYRCHKVGPLSPHMNALYFSGWLKKHKPKQYIYIFTKMIDYPKK